MLVQFALIVFGVLLYFGVRGLTEGNEPTALRHAKDLLRAERFVGLDLESRMQDAVLHTGWLVTASNWVYIWGHWPVIVISAVWLYTANRPRYIHLRDTFFVSGLIGMVIFAMYPVAPPRLAGIGLIDTVTKQSNSYRVLQPPHLVNRYAAFPSLHVGWNVVLGVAIFGAINHRLIRAIAVALPMAMSVAVVTTANHFVIDAIAGAGLAMFGYWFATRWPLSQVLPGGTYLGEGVEQVVPVTDQTIDPPAVQTARRLEVVDAPRQHEPEPLAQLRHEGQVEQPSIDRHAVEGAGRESTQQPPKLSPTAC